MKKISTMLLSSFLLVGCANSLTIAEESLTSNVQSAPSAVTTIPEKKVIDAPMIKQLPELPRGCEVTSLAMLLQYAGVKVDKMTLAKQVKKDPTRFQKRNGQVFFGNPNTGFVGDMYSIKNPGLGVYAKPIKELAEQYIPGKVINLTGSDFNDVLEYVRDDKPVWVITNTTYAWLPERFWQTWNTPTGQIKITYKEHSVLVTGYDDQYVYFNDPMRGIKNHKVSKEQFIKSWEQIGKQAITFTD
ncbi:C39 family peptidase [Alkalihalobacillus sp. AL-G]|uniref:C39 family peptidase n=1 Tax=Alkalihalobacillus sp. AL-G TaxID=2926399 RepID=UPI00272D9F2F|nr:C39 family peptidase [Alkalihalobacillus sp. AL-G]WLD94164.1 C39 family peptidase [Alkalihalobacillus sp. AL-G]